MLALVVALAFILMAQPSIAQDTLKPGDVISGQLRLVRTEHPNGTPISAYQIVSDHPKKFARADDFCEDNAPPKTFHLAVIGDDSKAKWARLKQLAGTTIAVVAENFFCSQTAWHIGDAVMVKWHLVEPNKR